MPLSDVRREDIHIKNKIAFGCYGVVILIVALIGLRFLFASKIMLYHSVTMGTCWENITPGMQIMSLNFMKAAGTGFISTAIAASFLLFIPFKDGNLWSKWAIPMTLLNQLVLILVRAPYGGEK